MKAVSAMLHPSPFPPFPSSLLSSPFSLPPSPFPSPFSLPPSLLSPHLSPHNQVEVHLQPQLDNTGCTGRA
jgi:hypothetical protein